MSEEQGKKRDIKALLAVIPPPMALRRITKLSTRERRVRVRHKDNIKENEARINPKLAAEINATNYIEVIIAGKKKFTFKVVFDELIPVNEIWCNSELLRRHGIADNSIATVRGK